MSFKIIYKDQDDPVLVLHLENDHILQFSVKHVDKTGQSRLGEVLEVEINRIIRESVQAERDRIQQGIKDLLGIKGTGRQG